MNEMNVPFGRPWVSEEDRKAVLEVLEGHIWTHGPQGKAFEAEFAAFLGGGHCVCVSSGMAALHLAYLHFGIGPGDEVVVPAQTHVATAHAVEMVGARPVFADCDPLTGNVIARSIEERLTDRTKAISVVHYAGIPCRMDEICALAASRGLRVIEDCAIALGGRLDGRHVGLWGDAGCYSFYPVKHISTGEGGMFVTRHAEMAAAIGRLRAFGVDRTHQERALPGLYDVPTLGLNYRMGEMQAALGRPQLRRLGQNLTRRRANFERLRGRLSGVAHVRVIDATEERVTNSHYCLTAVLEGPLAARRDTLVRMLNARGVGTSVYYPQPVPRLAYYASRYGYDAAQWPSAARISDCSIALPVGPHVGTSAIDYVADRFVEVVGEVAT